MNRELIEQYKILHKEKPAYGNGATYFDKIVRLCEGQDCWTALDYGCGKGALADKINERTDVVCDKYDPAIEEYSVLPDKKYDIVIANDVLEHLHPSSYLSDIRKMFQLSKKMLFFNISCRAAKFFLPNGKNCHTMIAGPDWWTEKLYSMDNVGKNYQTFHEGNQNLEMVIILEHPHYCYDCRKPMIHFEDDWACPKCEKPTPKKK
jgi:hypothetical protein